ncbi:MAG: hypothetical protein E6618_09430 [Staphylococcus warneri]|jgi:hypothetical protein|nr:hypothetical protein [Staphylococcus lugdunensis]MDU6254413.1 hypothetical protein [Staphylococcus warneri]
MVNDGLREKFEESYYELEEHKMNEFVGVDLGGGNYIDIVKSQGETGMLIINYVYNDEIIKTSFPLKKYVVESLIELSYYPEVKLQELSNNIEIEKKKQHLVVEMNKHIYMANDELNSLLEKINLYKKIYNDNDIEKNIYFELIRDKITQIDSLIRNEGLKHG